MSIAPRTGRKTAGDWSAKSGGRRAWFSGVAMGCTCNQRRTQCRSIAHLECRSTFPWPCSRGGQSWAAHAQEAPLCLRAAVCRPEPAPVSNSAGCAQRTEARAGPDHQFSATPNNNNKRNKNRPTFRSAKRKQRPIRLWRNFLMVLMRVGRGRCDRHVLLAVCPGGVSFDPPSGREGASSHVHVPYSLELATCAPREAADVRSCWLRACAQRLPTC